MSNGVEVLVKDKSGEGKHEQVCNLICSKIVFGNLNVSWLLQNLCF